MRGGWESAVCTHALSRSVLSVADVANAREENFNECYNATQNPKPKTQNPEQGIAYEDNFAEATCSSIIRVRGLGFWAWNTWEENSPEATCSSIIRATLLLGASFT